MPRHEIPCNCEKLIDPLEYAAQQDEKVIIEVESPSIKLGDGDEIV